MVEDNEDTRDSLTEYLRAKGHQVSSAANGREALLALSQLPRPCVVLLDWMMPVMGGEELMRLLQLQDALEGVTVVAVTGRRNLPDGMPLRAVLPKPLDLGRLMNVVGEFAPRPAA
ncbi:response regulator [Pyxidicoccus xibeiensis]|uniref:response regulator n=1 Tax=Pyxidicoccus xibeiensis TaxID=2906759 RepID=UPI0020A7181D|nr:response regulator [Pyxidicoccus xibeiensis]MCP3144895.1 response regulator [Pyxidicoccus xibeiensis]